MIIFNENFHQRQNFKWQTKKNGQNDKRERHSDLCAVLNYLYRICRRVRFRIASCGSTGELDSLTLYTQYFTQYTHNIHFVFVASSAPSSSSQT